MRWVSWSRPCRSIEISFASMFGELTVLDTSMYFAAYIKSGLSCGIVIATLFNLGPLLYVAAHGSSLQYGAT